jgi:CTP:molybdopterin cytidylyltransferase MocA
VISAILLAAGEARRFGAPKLLEDLHGRPVVYWSAELLRRTPVDEVIVVVAPDHDGIRNALRDVDVKFIVNATAHLGMGTSIASGVAAVHPSSEAVLVALGDEPMLGVASLRRVVERYRAGGAAVVVPTYRGTRGHPVLFERSVFQELLALRGDQGARSVTERLAAQVSFCELAQDAPIDVDTPDDLERLRAAPPRPTVLDELMPRYDVGAAYDTVVEAPMRQVYQAVLETDLAKSLVSRFLMAIRSLGRRAPSSFRFGQLPPKGAFFALASDPPREVVAGVMGRFWAIDGAVADGTRAAFEEPLPAGMAKAAWSFRVEDHAGGSLLTTETRILCADDDARRQFLRYWTLVGPFSGIIRREALRLIRAHAHLITPPIH